MPYIWNSAVPDASAATRLAAPVTNPAGSSYTNRPTTNARGNSARNRAFAARPGAQPSNTNREAEVGKPATAAPDTSGSTRSAATATVASIRVVTNQMTVPHTVASKKTAPDKLRELRHPAEEQQSTAARRRRTTEHDASGRQPKEHGARQHGRPGRAQCRRQKERAVTREPHRTKRCRNGADHLHGKVCDMHHKRCRARIQRRRRPHKRAGRHGQPPGVRSAEAQAEQHGMQHVLSLHHKPPRLVRVRSHIIPRPLYAFHIVRSS